MMQFGVFDHLDRNDLPLADFYEARLKIIESYDRAGFYAYHVAEHHSTPLGLAPSPSVFLSAVAQRTQRLRFGPMVYALPLYHPIRMIEEICMLDQMSHGRFEMGFGRGSVGIELEYYGEDPKLAQEVYAEALELVLKGLTEPVLSFHGKFFNFDNVPMELKPLQKPYPPVWYGLHAPESAKRAAQKGLRVISLDSVPATRVAFDPLEATLHDREHRLGDRVAFALGDRADQHVVTVDRKEHQHEQQNAERPARPMRAAPVREGVVLERRHTRLEWLDRRAPAGLPGPATELGLGAAAAAQNARCRGQGPQWRRVTGNHRGRRGPGRCRARAMPRSAPGCG